MICHSCADNQHYMCRGGTYCDCQHREGKWTQDTSDSSPQDKEH